MTTTTQTKGSRPTGTESAAMLRWDFLCSHEAATCEVRTTGTDSYEVCVVPHWDVSSSMIEPFAHPVAALRRHAEIAWRFQEAGFRMSRGPVLAGGRTEVAR